MRDVTTETGDNRQIGIGFPQLPSSSCYFMLYLSYVSDIARGVVREGTAPPEHIPQKR